MALGEESLPFGAPLTDLGAFALLHLPSSSQNWGRKGLGQSFGGRKEPPEAAQAPPLL